MNNQRKQKPVKALSPYLVLGLIIGVILLVLNFQSPKVNDLTTGDLLKALQNNEVTEITITPKSDESVYYVEGILKGYEENETFKTRVVEEEISRVTEYISENDISKYDTNKDPGASMFMYILVNVVPFVIMIALAYVLFSKLASTNKNSMDFGRSKAKLSDGKDQKTFKDVAGLKEEKEEVKELIDFIKNGVAVNNDNQNRKLLGQYVLRNLVLKQVFAKTRIINFEEAKELRDKIYELNKYIK